MTNVTPIAGRRSAPAPLPRPVPPFPPPRPKPAPEPRPLPCRADLFLLAPAEAGAAKAREIDGELLACCAEAHELDAEADTLADALNLDLPLDDPRWQAACDMLGHYWDAITRATSLPARTPEGLHAKAELALFHAQDGDDDPPILLSLARDVAGRIVA